MNDEKSVRDPLQVFVYLVGLQTVIGVALIAVAVLGGWTL